MGEKPHICPVCQEEDKGEFVIYGGQKMCVDCMVDKHEAEESKEEKNRQTEQGLLEKIFGKPEGEMKEKKEKADKINKRIKGAIWISESRIVYKVSYCGLCDCYSYSCPEKECMGTGCNGAGCDKCSDDHDEWYRKNLHEDFEHWLEWSEMGSEKEEE